MANDNGGKRPDDTYSFESFARRAGKAAVTAERLYHEYEIGKRLTGATAGAKAGFLLGRFAGPKGIIGGPILGAVLGAAYGPEGIDKGKELFNSLVDQFKPPRLPPPEEPDPMDARYPHRLDL